MTVHETFSKRQKRQRGEMPDVYQYDRIPYPLRVQLCQITDDVLGDTKQFAISSEVRSAYNRLVKDLRRERGVFVLPPSAQAFHIVTGGGPAIVDTRTELQTYILEVTHTDWVLDAVELICNEIVLIGNPAPAAAPINELAKALGVTETKYAGRTLEDNKRITLEAVSEINTRFHEHGVGYRFENGHIIRFDSEHIHLNVTLPALKILQATEYNTANDEYMKAFDHYKQQRYGECLNECLKAFESVMKVICAKCGWEHAKGATANTLIQVCIKNGLIPSMLDAKMNSLISLLSSSVPTIRNATSGHGGGTEKPVIPQHLARYVLDMTGAAIVFLANSESELVQP